MNNIKHKTLKKKIQHFREKKFKTILYYYKTTSYNCTSDTHTHNCIKNFMPNMSQNINTKLQYNITF